jgi:glycosyltransferase involved in cell wall biosynthesis
MRIVFLNPTGQIGGAERSLLDVMFSLRQAQPSWRIDLVAAEPGPLVKASHQMGISVHVLPLPRKLARLGDAGAGGPAGEELSRAAVLGRLGLAVFTAARYARALRRLLSELGPDLVHTNGFKMHVVGAWAKPRNTSLIWHIHDYVGSRAIMTKLLRVSMARCNAIICNSASVGEDIHSTLKPRIPIHQVWNAVDLDEFSPEGSKLDLDDLSGLPPAAPDVIRVGLVGTLAKWKGHEVFLRALALLPVGTPIRGYIIGGPVYQTDASQWRLADLKRQADRLGIAISVGFTGHVARPAEAMRSLDVVVHASTKPEPFGLVIPEAMACRRAVIASRAGGASQIFHDGVNALGHTPGDPANLSALILRLARDETLREQLGQAGRATAEQHFDRLRLGDELTPIYNLALVLHSMEAA